MNSVGTVPHVSFEVESMRRYHILSLIALGVAAPLVVALSLAAEAPPAATSKPPASPELETQFRRPVALAWVEPGRLAAVANSRSGSISLVDFDERRVVVETKIGDRLVDLTHAGDSDFYVALDGKTHELLLLKLARATVEIIGRLRVSDDPRRVIVMADGRTAVVTCRWSRRVDVVELRPDDGSRDPANWNRAFPRLLRSIELPFAPQEVVVLPDRNSDDDSSVVVADAFGGRLAVVDVRTAKITARHFVAGRNIRGLVGDAEGGALTLTCQQPDPRQATTADNLRLGKPARNLLVRFPVGSLVDAISAEDSLDGETVELDRHSEVSVILGAADPDDLVPLPDGRTAVLLAGVQQVALVDEGPRSITRIDVGAHPTAILFNSDDHRLIVANSLDDTLSIVDLRNLRATSAISLGPQPEAWPRDRGERLFFDGRQSLGGFMSCHSCHTDGHTSGDLADTLGDGTYGTPKRIPTLLGTSITDHWGWNGELRELRDQVDRSFRTSMHAPHYAPQHSDDVTAYLHTLQFPPPIYPQSRDAADERLVAAGRAVFGRERCAECHVPSLTYTSQTTFDVGLRDEKGLAKFNPPSLRGVGHGTTFFHDGRAKSLEELFQSHRHQLTEELSVADLRALVRYLQRL